MREIKIRGKAIVPVEELENDLFKHNNGWVYGNLIYNKGLPWIVGDIIEADPEYIVHEFWVRVYPKSVGQFTGLCDKNGKEIYEGDLLKHPVGVVAEIKYDNDTASFVAVYTANDDIEMNHLDKEIIKKCEVVGNIFENPELL